MHSAARTGPQIARQSGADAIRNARVDHREYRVIGQPGPVHVKGAKLARAAVVMACPSIRDSQRPLVRQEGKPAGLIEIIHHTGNLACRAIHPVDALSGLFGGGA